MKVRKIRTSGQHYLVLTAETIKEEKLLENIHYSDMSFRTSLWSQGYLNPKRKKSKKVTLKIF